MKHLITLLILSLCIYFAWRYAPEGLRKDIKQFLGKHLPWVALIVGLLFSALVGAFYTQSFNIL